MSSSEKPFKVAVSDAEIDLLKRKLELVRLPDEIDGAGWAYGAPLPDIRRLVDRWKHGYDWRARETTINRLPQFTRDIAVDGFGALNIHYVHQRSDAPAAIPLLFVHGWPGHFLEVEKILPLLTATSADHPSFHVVALSLPNFGFSEAPSKKGFSTTQHGEVCNKLMLALGYDKYVTQGGDWGYAITQIMAVKYGGKHVQAWHTNFPLAHFPSPLKNPLAFLTWMVKPYTAGERAGWARMKWFERESGAYFRQQMTQPQTLGYGLADSPVGLLAWLYEKLVAWTDAYPWTDDEVLDWVSLYWFSRAGPAASVRIYYEYHKAEMYAVPTYSAIPFGASFFPKELRRVPASWLGTIGNLVYTSEHSAGGHFAAHEQPEALVADLREMFGKDGPAFGVVEDKHGYLERVSSS